MGKGEQENGIVRDLKAWPLGVTTTARALLQEPLDVLGAPSHQEPARHGSRARADMLHVGRVDDGERDAGDADQSDFHGSIFSQ